MVTSKSDESLESKETPPEIKKPVGDEELDSAVQTTEEEEVKVEAKKEVKKPIEPEEEEDHRERSKLGRKVKQLEDIIQQQNERMEMLMNKLEHPASPVDEDVPEDVVKWFNAYERKKGMEQQKYSQSYLKSFYFEGKKDREANPELYDEVYNEMAVNFNVRYSNDPSMDAALNYAKAKAAVLAKKTATSKPKPNIKGEKPQGSTSLDVKSRAEPEPSEEVELDDEAKEFVKKIGMSQKSIKEALKGEAPAHLRK